MSPRAFALLCLLMGAACDQAAPAPRVTASSYDQTCQVADDCVLVYEGDLTCCGLQVTCPNSVINRSGSTAYEADVTRLTPTCDPQPICPFTDCNAVTVVCLQGFCGFYR